MCWAKWKFFWKWHLQRTVRYFWGWNWRSYCSSLVCLSSVSLWFPLWFKWAKLKEHKTIHFKLCKAKPFLHKAKSFPHKLFSSKKRKCRVTFPIISLFLHSYSKNPQATACSTYLKINTNLVHLDSLYVSWHKNYIK
jgi:hypothetical protein